VGPHIKRQPTGWHKAAVKAPQLHAAPGNGPVNQQRTQQAELAVELLAHQATTSFPLNH